VNDHVPWGVVVRRTDRGPGFAAFLKRDDIRDALIHLGGLALESPNGSCSGDLSMVGA
jgi:hypothetical protein